ncbi:hypothetical protein HPP92_027449 [Vanilla planifolia]|uniref:Uncharacterized protein n=1 Tax=Vanilla planifolia TaxID=51239 RepID=A0A835RW09_VANPL|nr:hypothetical protein HPP92_027449 [Vanilla planifolia]KAG0493092.1 hypothetical protein HPP92_006490 [Vanilla planifolia]
MSKQRFLWVLHPPSDADIIALFFDNEKEKELDHHEFLPSQTHVPTHGAMGGGLPMIAWPLYAEQPMNAENAREGVKVALRPIVGEDGVTRKETVANVVRELMEGVEE